MKLGDVLIVNDKDVGATKKKPRAVVVAKIVNNKAIVIPVYKSNLILPLEKFDGQRILSLRNKKLINKSLLYEQRGFKLKNCNLTLKEKEKLQSKVEEYL